MELDERSSRLHNFEINHRDNICVNQDDAMQTNVL